MWSESGSNGLGGQALFKIAFWRRSKWLCFADVLTVSLLDRGVLLARPWQSVHSTTAPIILQSNEHTSKPQGFHSVKALSPKLPFQLSKQQVTHIEPAGKICAMFFLLYNICIRRIMWALYEKILTNKVAKSHFEAYMYIYIYSSLQNCNFLWF